MESTKVVVVESMLEAPSEETPRLGLWLSNFDVTAAMTHTALVYYYPAPATVSTDRLRAALAKALVPFYPLAGRLGVDEDGRLQIDCHGEGALYVVATADCTGEDLFGNYVPSSQVRRMFVPIADPPSLMSMFQVTFLKCGGVVLGTAIHHVLMDGIGAFHFIQTWSGLARGLDVSQACPSPPSHDRTLLRGRSPPHADFRHPAYSSA